MRLDKHSVNLQEELGPNSDFINSMNYGALSDLDRERLISYYNEAQNIWLVVRRDSIMPWLILFQTLDNGEPWNFY